MITAMDTLVLNADGLALNLTKWKRAIALLLEGKADLVRAYENFVCPGIRQPAVIQLREYMSVLRHPSLTRKHILARDSFTCQFCGLRPRTAEGRPRVSDLNIDHVVPKAQAEGGKVRVGGRAVPLNSWGNLVACLETQLLAFVVRVGDVNADCEFPYPAATRHKNPL